MDLLSVLSRPDWSQIGQLILQHLLLILVAVGLVTLAGVPLGVLMTCFTWLAGSLQGAVMVMPITPSIVLFGLLMPVYSVFGQSLGPPPVIIAVLLYSLPPILRNTYLAPTGIEVGIREVDEGIGMTFWQRLWMVDIPLAMPVTFTDARTAAVMNIGMMTVAAVIGTGGPNVLILISISQSNILILVIGAVLANLLVIVVDPLLQWL